MTEDGGGGEPPVEPRLARPGGISYLHIPAVNLHQAAVFYERVFGWRVSGHDSSRPTFDDAGGHVSGAWVTDQAIAPEPGLLLYIYVADIDETVRRVVDEGGQMVSGPRPEGNLRVATFRDPAGNVLGLWQQTNP